MYVDTSHSHRTETVVHSDAAFASVSYLRVQDTELVEKPAGSYGREAVQAALHAPPLLDPLGQRTLAAAQWSGDAEAPAMDAAPSAGDEAPAARVAPAEPSVHRAGAWVAVGDVAGPPTGAFEDEVRACFERLATALAAHGLGMTDLAHVNVSLASQALFPAFNAVYRTYFGAAPPSRACVAVPLGEGGARVLLDAVAHHDTQPPRRRALHVQSRSYWAPANIGPYSQAVCTDHRVWIAGQIGMEPSTLAVPHDAPLQAALALQHARRIVLAVREWSYAPREGYVEGGMCYVAAAHAAALASAVARVWHAANAAGDDDDGDDDVHAHQQSIEDTAWLGEERTPADIPLLIVQLAPDALPKHAAVEWQLTASTGRSQYVPHDDDDEVEAYGTPAHAAGSFVRAEVRCTYRMAYAARLGTAMGVATLAPAPGQADTEDAHAAEVCTRLASALQIRLVHRGEGAAADRLLARLVERRATAHVPALGWGLVGEALTQAADAAALVFLV